VVVGAKRFKVTESKMRSAQEKTNNDGLYLTDSSTERKTTNQKFIDTNKEKDVVI
jgi:hypothetical protein